MSSSREQRLSPCKRSGQDVSRDASFVRLSRLCIRFHREEGAPAHRNGSSSLSACTLRHASHTHGGGGCCSLPQSISDGSTAHQQPQHDSGARARQRQSEEAVTEGGRRAREAGEKHSNRELAADCTARSAPCCRCIGEAIAPQDTSTTNTPPLSSSCRSVPPIGRRSSGKHRLGFSHRRGHRRGGSKAGGLGACGGEDAMRCRALAGRARAPLFP